MGLWGGERGVSPFPAALWCPSASLGVEVQRGHYAPRDTVPWPNSRADLRLPQESQPCQLSPDNLHCLTQHQVPDTSTAQLHHPGQWAAAVGTLSHISQAKVGTQVPAVNTCWRDARQHLAWLEP